MKRCPACNFSFPDFHFVCDFDGTELVPAERLALIRLVPARPPSVWRFITSPKMLATLAILALFLAAAFIAYHQTTSRSTRTLLAATSSTAVSNNAPVKRTSSSRSEPATQVGLSPHPRPSSIQRSSVAGNIREKRNEHLSRQTVYRSALTPTEKQPKFVAMLKTTWRVLKRPFSF